MNLKVESNQPTIRSGSPATTGSSGPEAMTAAQALVAASAAFDQAFDLQPGGAPIVGPSGLIVGGQPLPAEAAAAQARDTLIDLETRFLQAPPSGPIADGFATLANEPLPAVLLEGAEVPLPLSLAPGLITKLLPPLAKAEPSEGPAQAQSEATNPHSDLGRAIAHATDKAWDKALAAVPTPGNPLYAPLFTGLETPEAKRIVSGLQPLLLRLTKDKADAPAGKSKPSEGDKKQLNDGVRDLTTLFSGDVDIVSLVTIVMMQCHRDRGQDVKDMMKEIQANNKAKAAMRDEIRSYKKEVARVQADARKAYKEAIARGDVDPNTSYDDFAKGVVVAWGTEPDDQGKLPPVQMLSPPPSYAGAAEPGYPSGDSLALGTHAPVNESVSKQGEAPTQPLDEVSKVVATGKYVMNGSKGAAAKQLQEALTAAGYPLTADGIFGPKTLAAVKKFQTDNGLKADGIVGPLTLAKLNERFAPKPAPAAPQPTVQPAAPQPSAPQPVAAAPVPTAPVKAAKPPFPPPLNPPPKLAAGMRMGSLDELNEFIGGMQDKLDSLSDVSMEKQMRLQMYMDSFNQTASMISNIQKKASETASTIIGNLK